MSLDQLSIPNITDRIAETIQKGHVVFSKPNKIDMRNDEKVAWNVVVTNKAMRLAESKSASPKFPSLYSCLGPFINGKRASAVVKVYAANPSAVKGTLIPPRLILEKGPVRTSPHPLPPEILPPDSANVFVPHMAATPPGANSLV